MAAEFRTETTFDAAEVQFGPMQRNPRVAVPVFVGQQKQLVIQTPPLHAPYGLSAFQKGNEPPSYSIEVSFKDAAADPKVADFQAKMRALDARVLAIAKERFKEWDLKKDSVEVCFSPLVKDDKVNKKTGEPYPPQMKTKVYARDGRVDIYEVRDEHGNKVDPEYVTKGCRVRLMLQLMNVWFMGKSQFGLNWKVLRVAVVDRPQSSLPSSFGFVDAADADRAADGAAGAGALLG